MIAQARMTGGLPHNGTATSKAAAESMRSRKATDERLILDMLARVIAGSTCDEMEQALGLSHQTCSARFNGLAARFRIVKAGYTRPTRTGRAAEVFVLGAMERIGPPD